MKTVKYSSIQFGIQNEQEQDSGNSSIRLPESTNRNAPQSSYAYKIQEGVAVPQHVPRKSEVNEQTSSSESEHKSDSKIIHKEKHLGTDGMLGTSVGVRSTSLGRSPNQGSTGIDVQNQRITVEKIEHTEAISTEAALQPHISLETFPGNVRKAFEASKGCNHPTTRSADTGFTGQSMAPARVTLRNSSEWISKESARHQGVTSTASSTPNKLSTEKIQYYQKHDSMPNITLHIHSKPKNPLLSNTSSPECGSASIKANLESSDAQYSSLGEKLSVFQTQVKTDASNMNFTAPGKIKIPNFEKKGPSAQEKERSLPPKVERIKFFQSQEEEKDEDLAYPDKLVISNFNKENPCTEEQNTSLPPKGPVGEQWITHTTRKEVLSDLPVLKEKMSLERIQFIQDQDSQEVDGFHTSSPGKIVIPDFSKSNSTKTFQHQLPDPKVGKITAQQWITHMTDHKEANTKELPQAKKLSLEKLQFLQNQETQCTENDFPTRPGKAVIPQLNTKDAGIQNMSPNPEKGITKVIAKDQVQTQLSLSKSQRSVGKIQFPDNTDTFDKDKPPSSMPGKLVIPDFNQDSYSTKVQEQPHPREPAKLNTELWITPTFKEVEHKEDLQSPTKKLSMDKLRFLQGQEATIEEKPVSRPGKLVIPDFNQESSNVEGQTLPVPSKEQTKISAQWITNVIEEEEVRAEPSLARSQFSVGKIQFPDNTDTFDKDKPPSSMPGKLVIPDFNQDSYSTKVQEQPPPREPAKLNTELWITPTFKEVEHKEDLQSPTKKLSMDKLRFLQGQEATIEEKPLSRPGKLVIPDFNQESSNVKGQTLPLPSTEKTNISAQWITNVIEEQVQAEPSLPRSQFSVGKIQFTDNSGALDKDKPPSSIPGKLVIPDFNQDSYSTKVQEQPPPQEPAKLNTELWITPTFKEVEHKEDLQSPTKKLSMDKLRFLQGQEATIEEKPVSRPGKLVIPDFNQESPNVEGQTLPVPSKEQTKISAQWITNVIEEEEVQAEPSLARSQFSVGKIQFPDNTDTVDKDKPPSSMPGKLVIPDFNQDSYSTKVQEKPPPREPAKLNTELWITPTFKEVEHKEDLQSPTKKLSMDKLRFLQGQEATIEEKPLSRPGKLVIPDFNQESSNVKGRTLPLPSTEKTNISAQWITNVVEEEVQAEPPLPRSQFSVGKIQFTDNTGALDKDKPPSSIPGKLVIPDFNQDSYSTKVQEQPHPREPAKLNTELWITPTFKEVEHKEDLQSPTKKLSMDKLRFLQGQEATIEEKPVSRPGKLVIPDFNQESSNVEGQTLPVPSKEQTKISAQWITNVIEEEEVQAEPSLARSQFSVGKIQFPDNTDTVDKDKPPSSMPGKLVIPDFNQDSYSTKVQEQPPPREPAKLNTELWITPTFKEVEHKEDLQSPTKKLSMDKLRFLQGQEATIEEKPLSRPGKLVIPDFNQESSNVKGRTLPLPSTEKTNISAQWITNVVEEEVQAEPPLPRSQFSVGKIQFTDNTVALDKDKPPSSIPGKLIIPDFNQDSYSTKVQEQPHPREPAKLNTELWITPTFKEVEHKEDLQSPTKKLSMDKLRFLQGQEATIEEKPVSRPGKLVIPDFNQESPNVEGQTLPVPSKEQTKISAQWITNVIEEEEVQAEPSLARSQFSVGKIQFPDNTDTFDKDKPPSSMPGKLVIPDFNQDSYSTKVQEQPPPREPAKLNTELWITPTFKEVEHKEDLQSPTKKLSMDKLRFLQGQEATIEEKPVSRPGKLVIPDFNQESSNVEGQTLPVPSKEQTKISAQWITNVIEEEEVQAEPSLARSQFSVGKIQFPDNTDTFDKDKPPSSMPGKLVIPDFNQDSYSTKVQEQPPPREPAKLNTELWITPTFKEVEHKEDLQSPTKKLSMDKLRFLQGQEATIEEKPLSRPGKLVIPDFNQESSNVKGQTLPLPSTEKTNISAQWITNVIEEEVQAEPSLPRSQFSVGKIQFTDNSGALDKDKPPSSIPGKLVIPDFNQDSYSTKVQEQPPPQEPAKLNTELWITPTFKEVEHKEDLQSPTKKLSMDKLRFLQGQEATIEEKPVSRPGKLVIPDFNQESPNVEGQTLPVPSKEQTKISAQWITNVIEEEEVQAEPSLARSQFSVGKIQFPDNTDTVDKDKPPSSMPGKLVIPDFNQDSYSTKVQEKPPPREPAKLNTELWITPTFKEVEHKEDLQSPTKKLSMDKLRFLQGQEATIEEKPLSRPGKLVIPDFNQESSNVKGRTLPLPSTEKTNISAQWITNVVEEEVQAEPPLPRSQFSVGKIQFTDNTVALDKDKPPSSIPGKLIIPDFNQDSYSTKVQEQPPPREPAKLNTELWITPTFKEVEHKEDLQSPTKKLSMDKLRFLQGQEATIEEKPVSRPGKLVIPDLNQESSNVEGETLSVPSKEQTKISAQWITNVIEEEEMQAEPSLARSQFSVGKIHFPDNSDTHDKDKPPSSIPGKLVIPDFNQDSYSTKVQEQPPPREPAKLNTELWITPTFKEVEHKEDLQSPTKKLSMDKLRFLQGQEATIEEKPVSRPGKLVIPDFNQESSNVEGQTLPVPSREQTKISAQWIKNVIEEEELEAEPSLPRGHLSVGKIEFTDDTDALDKEKPPSSIPGKLVIPDFNRGSSTNVQKQVLPRGLNTSVEGEKCDSKQWISQEANLREVDMSTLPNRLPVEKKQFLQDQETRNIKSWHTPGNVVIQNLEKESSSSFQFLRNNETQEVKAASVGKLTIPDFNQHSTSSVAQHQPYPVKQEEIHQSQSTTKSTVQSPRKLVIPEFGVHSFSVDIQNVGPSERDQDHEQWVTFRDLTSEKHPHAAKLSAEQLQCFQAQDAQTAEVSPYSVPRKVVIPNFDRSGSLTKVSDTTEPIKASKLNAEQWIKHSPERKDLRSEVPSVVAETGDRKIDKMKFIFLQDTQVAKITQTSAVPGELVIPDFHSDDCHGEVIKKSSLPKEDKRFQKRQTNVPEVSSQTNNPSALKMQFVNTQELHSVNRADEFRPGKLVIPDLSKSGSSSHVYETLSLPEEKKLHTEEWLTHSMTLQELRTTPLPVRNKLTEDRMQPFRTEQVCIGNEVDVAFPGSTGFPRFNQKGFSEEESDVVQSAELRKRNSLKLTFQADGKDLRRDELSRKLPQDKQPSLFEDKREVSPQSKLNEHNSLRLVLGPNVHEARQEAALQVNKLPAERLQFSNNDQPTSSEDKGNSFPSKLGKRNSLKLVFEANGQEIKPEGTSQVKKLSAERLQFSQNVPANFTVQEREVPRPPNLAKRNSLRLVFEADGREVKPEVRCSVNKLPAERMQFSQNAKSNLLTQGKEVACPPNMGKQNSLKLVFEANGQGRVKPEVTPQVNQLSAERLQLSHDAHPNFTVEERQAPRAPYMAKRNSVRLNFEADGQEVRPDVSHSVNKLQAERKPLSEDGKSILPTGGKVVALPPKLGKQNSLRLVFEANGREVKPEVTPQVKKLSAERLQFSQNVQPNFSVDERQVPSAPNLAKRNSLKLVLEADGREVRPEIRRPINKLSAERLQFTQDARAVVSVQNRDAPAAGRSRVSEKSDSFSLGFGNNQREEFRPIRPITRFTGGDLQLVQDEYTIPEFDADSFSMDDSHYRFTQNKIEEEPRNLQSQARISMPAEQFQVTPHLTTGDYAVIDFDPNSSSIQVHKESLPLQMGDLEQKGR
ncbi:hypothetical protein P5673_005751 [Acropora cervicornis]|uniref:Uncharacterized protein n=1 Tax=Acropora cervicornis TaxID=6130 RepID=A0AAD9QYS2_ACRCE|nr:hypothetical protein P5673_005751 [Acropora cervicornis]